MVEVRLEKQILRFAPTRARLISGIAGMLDSLPPPPISQLRDSDLDTSTIHSFQLLDCSTASSPRFSTHQYLAMRAMFRPQLFTRRLAPSVRHASNFRVSPAPPRLPEEEQKIFEELQRRSTGAFSTPREAPAINQSPHSSSPATPSSRPQINQSPDAVAEDKVYKVAAEGEGEELHPDIQRGAKPEFEGDVNPKTGEVGGPKNEPLRWGSSGDWSFNGRVTDF